MKKLDLTRLILSDNVKKEINTRARIFCFNYKDLAEFYNVEVDTIRHWISQDILDPTSLQSIWRVKLLKNLKSEKLDSICTLKADC